MDEAQQSEWILQPPGAGEVQFQFATGEGVELTPTARAALETLISELSGSEVEGFMFGIWGCSSLAVCNPKNCTLDNCQPLTTIPNCVAHSKCRIQLP